MSIEFVEKKRWLFLELPFTFTKYVIKEDMITVDTGVFTKVENDCYMYKVQDVEHTASIWERMAGLGTIVCYTGDTTHPKLLIEHIRNSKAIKEFILKESEEARLKRRTVNMLDIGSGEVEDIDDGLRQRAVEAVGEVERGEEGDQRLLEENRLEGGVWRDEGDADVHPRGARVRLCGPGPREHLRKDVQHLQ